MGRYDEMLARFMAFAEREPRILMGVQVTVPACGKTARRTPTRRSGCRKHLKIKPAKNSKTAPMKSVTGAVHFRLGGKRTYFFS